MASVAGGTIFGAAMSFFSWEYTGDIKYPVRIRETKNVLFVFGQESGRIEEKKVKAEE